MRIALGLEYNGASFYGWQRQREVQTVQAHLESAIERVANQKVSVVCAGRTDAGVHATGQVVHFDVQNPRPNRAWTMGLNANLPACIAVKWAKQVTEQFHARFSATARRYRYLIYNHMLRPAILAEGVTHIHAALDAKAMHEAGQSLVGEQDFSSFRAAMCQSHSPWRNINHLQVARNGDYVVLEIEANAFVHHMVRNIAGSLIEVGNCNQPMSWIKALLVAKDRTLAAATAKPNGLYLISVSYPEEFGIPQSTSGPLFLPATL